MLSFVCCFLEIIFLESLSNFAYNTKISFQMYHLKGFTKKSNTTNKDLYLFVTLLKTNKK